MGKSPCGISWREGAPLPDLVNELNPIRPSLCPAHSSRSAALQPGFTSELGEAGRLHRAGGVTRSGGDSRAGRCHNIPTAERGRSSGKRQDSQDPGFLSPNTVIAGKGCHACIALPRSISQGDGFKHHPPKRSLLERK